MPSINMPKQKSKIKQEHSNSGVGAPSIDMAHPQNDKSPAFNTRSAKKDMTLNQRKNAPKHQYNNQSKSNSEDHSNFYRLLQLFPHFPPIYLQRIYATCNKDFIRTIDNVLYVKRYCSYLNKKKNLTPISPIQNSSNELTGIQEQTENGPKENSLASDFEWIESTCKTPELEAPKYTSTPH